MTLQSICLCKKHDSRRADEVAVEVARWASERGVAVLEGDCLEGAARPDLVVVLGGDGTFLHAVRRLGEREVPILGVNLGFLGFLTEIAVAELTSALDALREGRLAVDRRMTLKGELIRRAGAAVPLRALNDVVVNKGSLARISDFEVTVDGRYLADYRGDGVIVSTPPGSTAYNHSAGGPIVSPDLSALVISPICPHAMSHRPIVLGGSSVVELTLRRKNGDVFATLDGQEAHPLEEGDVVSVRRGETDVLLVRSPDRDYFALLRTKLMWGGRSGEGR